MSIILLKPILVEAGTNPRCVNDDEPYKNFTDPILGGMASTGGEMPSAPTGNNVFNIYQANPDGIAGSDNGYSSGGVKTGSVKFGVTPCAEKIDFQIVGRRDIYTSSTPFDTLDITIDGNQEFFTQNTGTTSFPSKVNGVYTPALDGIDSLSTTFTHNFTTPKVCGHIVNISGASGSLANNNVGYDVKVTVTLRTTPIT